MTTPPSTETLATPEPQPGEAAAAFDALERSLRDSGPVTALAELAARLESAGEYRALLDALLLKARHELGLPLIQQVGYSSLPEPIRTRFEERYIEAVRLVASRLLEAGDIPTAWAYFRAIGEPEPIAAALESYHPDEDAEALGRIIDVAFNQGANPRRGFELILDHYGTCSAITALEQVPPGDGSTQVACIERLIRHLHAQLASSLRADILQRGQPAPEPGASIASVVESRDWLFRDEGYHTDISHLSATVRYSILVSDPAVLALALDLAEYGRRLSPRLQFEGAPPFERTFDDYRLFLKALLGQDQGAAIAYFRGKADAAHGDDFESSLPTQVLVTLLARIGRLDEAIDIASDRLSHFPETSLTCPGIAELCQRAGRLDRLAAISRRDGNLVNFLAARLQAPEHERRA